MSSQKSNVTLIRDDGSDRAVIFVHGYNGAQDDTWDLFPALLGSATKDIDIYTIGYATTLLPDVVGIWSADPDLPILATMLSTELAIKPFKDYKALTLIGHSMGGLVIQKALVDDPTLAARVQHVILFGTPSNGLRKAGLFRFWKRQLTNMAFGSPFIHSLRDDWKRLFGAAPPFNVLIVAGTSDQFVPPESSLDPFEKSMRRAVPGDHISIVKPDGANAASVLLVADTVVTGSTPTSTKADDVRLASETPTAPALVKALVADRGSSMSVKEIVDAALALDRAGLRDESIALLDRHKDKDTDIKGTLGGEEWQHKSAGLQAGRIAARLGDQTLINELDKIFTPAARQVNRIFVSYSHNDKAWLDRLVKMVKPYLRDAEVELKLWVDTDLKAGQQWDAEFRKGLEEAGVAVALVSDEFLASPYVVDHELPSMIKAAENGELQLLWVYVSSAGWEVTPLKNFQATHDTKKPLSLLSEAEQDEILKSVAQQMKAAALAATERFKNQPRQA